MKPYTLIKGTGWLAVVTLLLSWHRPEPVVPVALFADEKPDETRFSKVVLAENLNEPMELAVLPDGRVLVVERNGGILMYDPTTSAMRKILDLPVFSKIEDGLLGITLDPAFAENNWLYLFYSPVGDTPQQYVSRFTFSDGTIDLSSEKVLIKIPTQREECCHSGGSIAFGKDGNLFIATGDNTSPFGSNYYAPLDERPGREAWDAQRTAGNTNDLRGKILRIHPEPDGTYTIPEGNLFEKGTAMTRPEIYVMGCRNPIRISADQKNGYLYWGDVGQNGEKDSERGPRSWDEWNQATRAGNFGWPYFAGDNRPYAEYDFAQEKAGKFFDPQNPVNNSINNTGLKQLPPAQPAFIWYNYVESDLFPHLGTGGKSPMAGPVFYADQYKKSERSFPDYYNGKLFIFEWMRDWINVVTLKPDGSYVGIEPFMPNTLFEHPIDLEFGPDGAMYILEYGTYWFAQNANSKLTRIDYSEGNRPPVAKLSASTTVGAAPLTVRLSAKGSLDHDAGDALTFQWTAAPAGQSATREAGGETTSFTFDKPGTYQVTLSVSDKAGKVSTRSTEIKVGNAPPTVSLEWPSNRSFYWPNQTLSYRAVITDKEDKQKGGIDPKKAVVTFEYIPYGEDITLAAQNYESAVGSTRLSAGEKLINESDCKACHGLSQKSIGPSYQEIAKRYKNDGTAREKLARKVISGGNGNWGENAMSAHPQLTVAQTTEMVSYILSLAEAPAKSLPLTGTVVTRAPATEEAYGKYLMTVSYTDKGANGMAPLTTRKEFLLRPPVLEAISCDTSYKAALNGSSQKEPGRVRFTENEAFIGFRQLDLTGIRSIALHLVSSGVEGSLTLHSGSPTGPLLGTLPIPRSDKPQRLTTDLAKSAKVENVFFVYHDGKGKARMFNGPLFTDILFQK